ncbi:unnamed protein product [Calypogeia fissa]
MGTPASLTLDWLTIVALPQYHDELEKLSLHLNIATSLNTSEFGKLEQALVDEDAGSKELMNILYNRQGLSKENKLRLLMIYASTYPDKMGAMKTLAYVRPPSPSQSESGRQPAQSVPSRRATSTWTSQSPLSPSSDDDLSLKNGKSVRSNTYGSYCSSKARGKRIFVFITGGMTHSELQVAHKLSDQLKREVIVGSTSLDSSHQFIEKVKSLSLDQGIMKI